MRLRLSALLLLFLGLSSLALAASERQKAEKQINRISAMAADLTGRRLVNLSLSQQLNIPRQTLVDERRRHNLNYGTLFLFRQIAPDNDLAFRDLVFQMKSGMQPYDIAESAHADWKLIANQARKLNSRIEDNIYNFFLHEKNEKSKDRLPSSDAYNPLADSVVADTRVSEDALAEAQDVYLFWQARATGKKDNTLDRNKELAARQTLDPVRKGGAQNTDLGNIGPAANTTPH
jgi:hypothetical protein